MIADNVISTQNPYLNSNQNENFLYFYSIWYKTIVGHQLLKICIDIPIEFDI